MSQLPFEPELELEELLELDEVLLEDELLELEDELEELDDELDPVPLSHCPKRFQACCHAQPEPGS